MKQLEKVKTFVKEHKKEIFITAVSSIVGVTVGVSVCKFLDKDFIKIKWGNGNIKDARSIICPIANKSSFKDFGWPYESITIGDLGEYGEELMDIYKELTKDTKLNGVLVMAD